jgi:hypothetical protein
MVLCFARGREVIGISIDCSFIARQVKYYSQLESNSISFSGSDLIGREGQTTSISNSDDEGFRIDEAGRQEGSSKSEESHDDGGLRFVIDNEKGTSI